MAPTEYPPSVITTSQTPEEEVDDTGLLKFSITDYDEMYADTMPVYR